MKKIFENFYIFSKFALSFTLLVCLIGLLYIFYVNYNKESYLSKSQLSFEKKIQESINNNSNLINKVENKMRANELTLIEIKKSIQGLSAMNKNNDIVSINENIETLNNNFTSLYNEIDSIKNNLHSSSEDKNLDILDKSYNDIIDLILIKYENNINFNLELDYLIKILGSKKNLNIEKLSILSTDTFNGYEYLDDIFNKEVNKYFKETANKNTNSFFSKIILPYVEISPSSENKITDNLIIKIKKIKFDINNRNVESALKNLETIKNYRNIFKLSTIEIDKYIKFKTELYRLK